MGPSVWILLPKAPSSGDIARLDEIARSLGPDNCNVADFHVETTAAIGGKTRAAEGGRPFVGGFEEPTFEPGEPEAISAAFGFVPTTVIEVGAMCNDRIDHVMLGEIAVYLAEQFGGIVGFNGFLGRVHARIGKLAKIPYTVDGRELFSHVGDAAFLEEWLTDPAFHMVK